MPEQDKHSNTKQLVLAMCIPSKLSGNECALCHYCNCKAHMQLILGLALTEHHWVPQGA